MPAKFLPILIALFLSFFLKAQEHPPIQVYTPNEYSAENQNWAITQSKEKYIYVANNKGLLEFNGAKWNVYNSPNNTIIRSVNVIDDLIYTGCYREFGYWQRNLGILDYTSLSSKLKIDFLDDEEIWNIISIDDYILFQSLKRIYIYSKKDKNYTVINSTSGIHKIFKINDAVYFQKPKEGVFEIVNGASKLISDHPVLKDNLLVNIYNHDDTVLFLTEDNGFYVLKEKAIIKWDIPANNLILQDRTYSSIKLKDHSFIIGSISNGIVHVSKDGAVLNQINQNSGLSNNTILSVFEDIDSNLWLGLENGINCINIKSPFTIYNDEKGKIGSVNTSVLFKGNLYLGTNQGVFFKRMDSDEPFKFIKGTQGAVWCLKNIDNTLFCGHNSGTFIIDNEEAILISDLPGTWNIQPINNKPHLLIQGNYTGLTILEKKSNTWQLRNEIEGFNISSRYFEMLDNNDVFVNHEYKGVFKIKLNEALTKAVSVVQDSSISKGSKSSLIKYKNDLLYTQKEGVFKYITAESKFVKDTVLSDLFTQDEYTSGKLVYDTQTDKLWSFSLQGLNYLAPSRLSSTSKINKISLPSFIRSDISGYENISYLYKNKYLYGNTSGYIIMDLDKIAYSAHKVHLNVISINNLKKALEIKLVNSKTKGDFRNNENNLEFNYSVPEYEKYLVAEYQYKLDGIYDEWSNWSTKSNVAFENLPYGEYTFYVKSRIGNEVSENTASYAFVIETPWYLSTTGFTFYLLLVGLFSLLMHNIYKRYYRKQRERLLYKTQRELELKELENKEQLMRHNNEKLKLDIENKNRDLDISTMSLIKKNEFLNNIKKELLRTDHNKNLKNVIKIIDNNINNTDDWRAFEEAFNNADKDFLKKIKILHPALTSHDLRLCAYLRLNLSSKEIAPLLNISARSVEVKRYRLRKKMGLSHESSLIDYILTV